MADIKRYTVADGRDCVLSHYDSVSALEADCLTRPMTRSANIDRRAQLETMKIGRSWYGVDSLAEVKQILREGYPEGAKQVDVLHDSIAPTLPRAIDFRRQRVRSDQGDSLDIHAVNRGALDKAWTTVKRKAHAGTGLIRIAVDICGNGHVPAASLKWRGIAALALSRIMSKAGYSVEMIAGQGGLHAFSSKPELYGAITVTVKPRYAVIDTATIAATVCLPGFFRYAGFASIIRQADDVNLNVAEGLGRAIKLETLLSVPEKIAQVIAPETINDSASAEAWVKEAITLLQGATMSKERNR